MATQTARIVENGPVSGDSIDRLITTYGGRAPRYTSYPTALQFTPDVAAAQYGAWLKGLKRESGPVSAYLHIPFCERMCWYCGCNTAVVNRRGPIADYVGRLLGEIDLVAGALGERLEIGNIHFGGGTPNMLAPDEIGLILARLAERFDIAPGAEIAAEIDPCTLTEEWVKAAARGGMNRASLGVQDFDPDVQKAINRIQPYETTARAVELLRAAGAQSLNMDLIYGLPRQTLAGLEKNIDMALALGPDRLSLFGYAHVPWMKAHQKLIREDELPAARLRHAMQRRAADLLEATVCAMPCSAAPPIFWRSAAGAALASTISPVPTTALRPQRSRAGCAAISRAIRPTPPPCSSASAPPPSAGCRRATSRTPPPCRSGAKSWRAANCRWRAAWR